ncbi:MAG: dockerin type I domain-containing protein, partial [Planctomycetota bacterium]|nr:dockerin type I domain-containing protein [Planctomycetota bacterium]
EAGTTDTFAVVLNRQPLSNVVLAVSSSDPGEATVDKATLTFTPSNWSQAQTVTVTGVDDLIVDGNQTTLITLAVDAAKSDDAWDALPNQTVSVVTTDNDLPGLTLSTTTVGVMEPNTKDTFTVVLARRPLADVVILVTASDATETTVDKATLRFTSSDWNLAQTVTIAAVDDLTGDGAVMSTVTLSVVGPDSDEAWNVMADRIVWVTTYDDDTPGFALSRATADVWEPTGTATFTVVLTRQPLTNVVFSVTASDATEATVDKALLTFRPADWNTAQTVTITAVDDSTVDGAVGSLVTVFVVAASSDNAFRDLPDQTVSVTTNDDDVPGFTLSKTTATVTEPNTTDTFAVVLTRQPLSDVVFSALASDGTEDQTVVVTTNDDDVPGFTLSKTTATVTEPNTTDTFTVVLTRQPLADVVFSVLASDATEATVDKATLTFTPANWNTTQTVTITAVDDSIVDGAVGSLVTVSVVDASSDSVFRPLADQTVSVTTNDDDTSPTVDIVDVTPDPRNTAVTSIQIVFSEAVGGFDLADVALTRDGGSNLLTGAQTLTTSDSLTWTLGNLSGLTGVSGSYELQLTAGGSGIQDVGGNALGGDASDAWTTLVVGPTWQNPRHPCDVTGDGYITAIDVLTLISDINTSSSRDLATASYPTPAPPPFLDPSGDGQLTPTDVLIVINYINRFGAGLFPTVSGGEGEFTEPPDVVLRLQTRDAAFIESISSSHPKYGRGDPLAQTAGAQCLIPRGLTEQRSTITASPQVRLRTHRQDGVSTKFLISPTLCRPTKSPSPDDFVDMPAETTELEQAISAIAAEVARA